MKQKEITARDVDGNEKPFVIRRLGATSGFRMVELIPSLKDTQGEASREFRELCYSCIGVPRDGQEPLWLITSALVDNHVADGVQLAHLVAEVVQHNTGFFGTAEQPGFLDYAIERLVTSLTPTLTRLSEPLLQQASQIIESFGTSSTSRRPSTSGKSA